MPRVNGSLKRLRLEAKRSQNKFAREADLDRATVSSAENGGEVQELTVEKMADALTRLLGRRVTAEELCE